MLDYAALVLVEFLINPLLVRGLGNYLYGAWRVLWKLTGYLWATSGRSAPALQLAIANKQHSSDVVEKQRYVASAVAVWVMFLPILAAVGALGVWLAPTFLRTPTEQVGAVRLAAALLVADSIALTLLTIPRAVLQGENLGYKRMGLSALLILLKGGFMVMAIRLDAGIAGVAAANLVNTVLTGALFVKVARTYVPWFGIARPSRQLVRWFLGLSWWFTAWKFINELMLAGDVIVLGVFAPLELVTVYTLARYIPDALSGLLAKALQGATPSFGGLIGAGDLRRAVSARREFMALTWLLTTATGATALVWTAPFLDLWVGNGYYPGPLPTLLIMVMTLQFVMVRNDAYVIDATLEVRAKVLVGLLSTLASIGLAALLVGPFDGGIAGLCIGFIAGRSVLTIAYPVMIARAIDHPLSNQIRGAVRPMLVSALLFGVAFYAEAHVSAGTWGGLVAGGAATGCAAAVVGASAGLERGQRTALIERFKKLTARGVRSVRR